MYIHRELEKEISPFLNRKEVIAIIGPRQAGKTTFIKYLEKNLKAKRKNGAYFFRKAEPYLKHITYNYLKQTR